jgi:hypothetical protein
MFVREDFNFHLLFAKVGTYTNKTLIYQTIFSVHSNTKFNLKLISCCYMKHKGCRNQSRHD